MARFEYRDLTGLPPLPGRFRRQESKAATAEWDAAIDSPTGLRSTNEMVFARAWIDALEAAAHPGVLSFRQNVLNGNLLEPSALAFWLSDRELEQLDEDETGDGYTLLRHDEVSSQSDGYGLLIKTIEAPLEIKVRSLPSALQAQESEEASDPFYDGTTGVYTVRVLATGKLGMLLSISRDIANTYGWPEDYTATWILTGYVPRGTSLDLDVSYGPLKSDEKTNRWARIHLTVSPETSPAAVAAFYRSVRSPLLRATGTVNLAAKGPALGDKQLSVAVFAAENNDGRTWRSLLEAWNDMVEAEEASWVYQSHRNFARDARDTHLRLMGVPLEWVGHRKKNSKSKEGSDDGEA
jgi:hypothetical protein